MGNKIILTHYVLRYFHFMVGNRTRLRTQITS